MNIVEMNAIPSPLTFQMIILKMQSIEEKETEMRVTIKHYGGSSANGEVPIPVWALVLGIL